MAVVGGRGGVWRWGGWRKIQGYHYGGGEMLGVFMIIWRWSGIGIVAMHASSGQDGSFGTGGFLEKSLA